MLEEEERARAKRVRADPEHNEPTKKGGEKGRSKHRSEDDLDL